MADREKVVENLIDLKEMLKWQRDIQGYGIYVDLINDAIELLGNQKKKKFLVDKNGKITPLPQIVRCNDCKHIECIKARDIKEFEWCKKIDIETTPDWFCADGERREKDG